MPGGRAAALDRDEQASCCCTRSRSQRCCRWWWWWWWWCSSCSCCYSTFHVVIKRSAPLCVCSCHIHACYLPLAGRYASSWCQSRAGDMTRTHTHRNTVMQRRGAQRALTCTHHVFKNIFLDAIPPLAPPPPPLPPPSCRHCAFAPSDALYTRTHARTPHHITPEQKYNDAATQTLVFGSLFLCWMPCSLL